MVDSFLCNSFFPSYCWESQLVRAGVNKGLRNGWTGRYAFRLILNLPPHPLRRR